MRRTLAGLALALGVLPADAATITALDQIRVTAYAQHHPATRNCCPSRSRALTEGRWRHNKHCQMPRREARGGTGGGVGSSSALEGTNLAGIHSSAPSGFSAGPGSGVSSGPTATITTFTPTSPSPTIAAPLRRDETLLWIATVLWLGWRGFRVVLRMRSTA